MNGNPGAYGRAIDEAKSLLDDLYAEINGMADAMTEIYNLAHNADADNWKDSVDRIQTIAEIPY